MKMLSCYSSAAMIFKNKTKQNKTIVQSSPDWEPHWKFQC